MKFEVKNRWSGKLQFTAEIECAASASVSIKRGLAAKWAYSTGAVLRDADLRDAVLRDADLTGAVLTDADLRDADLTGAVLRGVVLTGADLRDADLRDADLRDAVLRDADLTGAVLTGAVLTGVVLRGAVLRGADLTDADLRDADLTGAVLRGVVLTGADLRDADLTGVVLRGAVESIPLIPNIDAAILAAIAENKAKKQNGFDMRSWHGKECDETNWCQTTHCRAGYAICLAGKAGFDLERKFGPATAGMLLYLKSTPDAPIPDWGATNEAALADMKARAEKQLARTP